MTMAPVGLLLVLALYALGAFILYWIIRLAVRHALRDSARPPGPPHPDPRAPDLQGPPPGQ